MTYQFQTLETDKSGPVRYTFMEAWDDMYQYVKGLMDSGNMSFQLLEGMQFNKHVITLNDGVTSQDVQADYVVTD